MPLEPAILRGRQRIVIRGVENRVTEAKTVVPRLEMGEAEAQFKRQARRNLPGILHESLVGVVGDVVDAVEVGLRIRVQIAV